MGDNSLTKAEEQVMHCLWQLKKGFLKDIMEVFPEPKPHSNTVATILKILIEKGFVGFNTHGRQHEYFPLMNKSAYSERSLGTVVHNYFDASYKEAVSFLVKRDKMSIEDLEMLLNELKKKQ